MARRALEIAAAGGHHMLMIGPPGAGKSMLSARLSSLLPSLTPAEALEVTMIHSIAGTVPETGLVIKRPFRDPHHSASMPALVGGGMKVRPGEISLAHHGVLFLDELAEFNPAVLDSLRQPLETGEIIIARAQAQIRYPARFQLIAAMNPCRCGYPSDPVRNCGRRVSDCTKNYLARVSGPMLDRFDMVLDVAELDTSILLSSAHGETSSEVAKRVAAARRFMSERSDDVNARLNADKVEQLELETGATALLERTLKQKYLSARGFHKTLRVARTIADLDASEQISELHMAEALHYRLRELLA